MTRRLDLRRHQDSLADIRKIIRSMQSLAYIETRKLGRKLPLQQRQLRAVERAAADFLAFHPVLPLKAEGPAALIVIGSERGFCGDFNERLAEELTTRWEDHQHFHSRIIGVGGRLCGQLRDRAYRVSPIDGADMTEELDRVLGDVLGAVQALREQEGPLPLTLLFHDADAPEPVEKVLLPPFGELSRNMADGAAPLLNLPPDDILPGLVEHYLLATLNESLHASLMAESRRRVQQLEAAGRHLDKRLAALERKGRQLRQEEIIEEIEVILLGAGGPLQSVGHGLDSQSTVNSAANQSSQSCPGSKPRS